jgi:hypothetical protein
MLFRIFSHNQCKRLKFQHLNKPHLTLYKKVETTQLVTPQNQKNKNELNGGTETDLDQIQKDLPLKKLLNHNYFRSLLEVETSVEEFLKTHLNQN